MLACELIRKNDEHWRDNLIGLTFNKRLEKAIMERHSVENQLERLELQKERLQDKLVWLNSNLKTKSLRSKPLEALPSIYEAAMVSCLGKHRKILDIGFNTPEDLNLNNWGIILAGLFRTPSQVTNVTVSVTNTANAAKSLYIYGISTVGFPFTYITSYNLGTQIQFGSSTTAATRADYKIGTALGTAPESSAFATGPGSYASGYISFSGAVSAGGSGTVNEMGCFGNWLDSGGGAADVIMIFHDILSSGVSYSAGNTLNGSYSISM